jgi:hypothetical protein
MYFVYFLSNGFSDWPHYDFNRFGIQVDFRYSGFESRDVNRLDKIMELMGYLVYNCSLVVDIWK